MPVVGLVSQVGRLFSYAKVQLELARALRITTAGAEGRLCASL